MVTALALGGGSLALINYATFQWGSDGHFARVFLYNNLAPFAADLGLSLAKGARTVTGDRHEIRPTTTSIS